MTILLAVLALTGSLLAAAGTWLSSGWLILVGGMTLLISMLAVPSTRSPASPPRRPVPRSLSHDLLRNPAAHRDTIRRPILLPAAMRAVGRRRIAEDQADHGHHP